MPPGMEWSGASREACYRQIETVPEKRTGLTLPKKTRAGNVLSTRSTATIAWKTRVTASAA